MQRGNLGFGGGHCLSLAPGEWGCVCGGRCQELPPCARSLVTDFPQGVRECREPQLGLEELLRHRCQLLQQHEEYQVGPASAPAVPSIHAPIAGTAAAAARVARVSQGAGGTRVSKG